MSKLAVKISTKYKVRCQVLRQQVKNVKKSRAYIYMVVSVYTSVIAATENTKRCDGCEALEIHRNHIDTENRILLMSNRNY